MSSHTDATTVVTPANKLAAAFTSVGPSPCETFSCSMRDACSELLLACDAFRHYAETGRSFTPYIILPKHGHAARAEFSKDIITDHEKYLETNNEIAMPIPEKSFKAHKLWNSSASEPALDSTTSSVYLLSSGTGAKQKDIGTTSSADRSSLEPT